MPGKDNILKKYLKKLLVVTLIVILAMSGTVTAFGTESLSQTEIKVQYNGKDIAFADAAPKIINGRTMVPFRQVLETMGAEVTYIEATRTVIAKKEQIEFIFKIGGTDITINENGKTVVKKMDVIPYLDTKLKRTYVPARFMAESLGYFVGWDSINKTAIIIDTKTLLQNVDNDFSIIAKLMNSDLDLSKPYATSGNFDVDFTTYNPMSPSEAMTFSINGDISGVQHMTNADLVINFLVNLDTSKLPPEAQDSIKLMLEMLADSSMKIKMNGDTGIMYMNSNLYSTLDPSYDSNTWFKMDLFKMYDEMGFDIRPWMNRSSYSDIPMSEIANALFSSMEYCDTSTYQDMKVAYTFLKNLIGNDAFKQQTASGITTYSLSLNGSSILSALLKTVSAEGITMDSVDISDFGDIVKNMNISSDITIKEKNGTLYSYDIKANGEMEMGSFSLAMSGDQRNAVVNMTIDQENIMKMVISADSKLTETTKKPILDLPPDAKVVDYDTLMPNAF
jgi:hypothetical protein